jgi:hypothetical protein
MAILQWVILCERAIIEETTRAVSMMSLVEDVTFPPPPDFAKQEKPLFIPYRFYVVQQWTRSKPKIGERVSGQVTMYGPKAQKFGESKFLVDLTGTPRARIILQTFGFPLHGDGVYTCVVQALVRTKWRKVGQAEFRVVFADNVGNRRIQRSH